MVDAAQAILFVATEEQRSTPMRASVLDQADVVGSCAEGDQLLAQQLDADWWTVRLRSFIRFSSSAASTGGTDCPSACLARYDRGARCLPYSASLQPPVRLAVVSKHTPRN